MNLVVLISNYFARYKMGKIATKFGLRIKELREQKGLTQLKLAEILNMESSNLSKIERGIQIPKEESLEKLARAFDIDVRDLFDFEHYESKEKLIKRICGILENSPDEIVRKYYKILINLS